MALQVYQVPGLEIITQADAIMRARKTNLPAQSWFTTSQYNAWATELWSFLYSLLFLAENWAKRLKVFWWLLSDNPHCAGPRYRKVWKKICKGLKHRRIRPSLSELHKYLRSVAASYAKALLVIDTLDDCETLYDCPKRLFIQIRDYQIPSVEVMKCQALREGWGFRAASSDILQNAYGWEESKSNLDSGRFCKLLRTEELLRTSSAFGKVGSMSHS